MTFRSVGIELGKGIVRVTIWSGLIILAAMLLGVDLTWRVIALCVISDIVDQLVYGAVK